MLKKFTGQASVRPATAINRQCKALTERAFRAAMHTFPGIYVHEPPVPHLLNSNAVPTEEEEYLIKCALVNAELLSLEFRRILEESECCGKPRRRAQPAAITRYNLEHTTDFIRQQNAVLSPIRNIPPEILEQIFIATPPMLSISGPRRNADLPWALSQVCRLWRATALSTPTLWATLPRVNLSADSTGRPEYLAFLLELLQRARHLIVDIYVDGKIGHGAHPVLDALVANSAKWEAVYIQAPVSIISRMKGIKGRLPELQVLYLAGERLGEWGDLGDGDIDLFQSAPKLRGAFIEGIALQNVVLPYSQLLVYCQEYNEAQLEDLISTRCPNLRELSIREFREPAVPRDVPRRTTILNLTKFVCEFASFPVVFQISGLEILDSFVLPVLQELKITAMARGLAPAVFSLLYRSRSSVLKKICLRTTSVEPDGLRALLLIAPSIEHLSITLPPAEDIRYIVQNPTVARRLRTCGFYTTEKALSADSILALQSLAECCETNADRVPDSAAYHSSRTLETVYVQNGSQFSPRFEESLEKQRQLGGWSSTSHVYRELCQIQHLLLEHVPEIHREWERESALSATLTHFKDPVKGLLLRTKKLPVTDVAEIYASQIHHTLTLLRQCRNGRYQKAVGEIFAKWKPMVEASAESLRWAMVERHHLIYLSKKNKIRCKVKFFQMINPCGFRRTEFPHYFMPCLDNIRYRL